MYVSFHTRHTLSRDFYCFYFSVAISVSVRLASCCGNWLWRYRYRYRYQRYSDRSYMCGTCTGQLYIAPQIPVVRQSSIFEHY